MEFFFVIETETERETRDKNKSDTKGGREERVERRK